MAGEVLGSTELPGVVAKGLLNGEGVFVVGLEGEVTGFAIERRIACHSEAFGVVEDDDWILVRNPGVEPGKTAAGEGELRSG